MPFKRSSWQQLVVATCRQPEADSSDGAAMTIFCSGSCTVSRLPFTTYRFRFSNSAGQRLTSDYLHDLQVSMSSCQMSCCILLAPRMLQYSFDAVLQSEATVYRAQQSSCLHMCLQVRPRLVDGLSSPSTACVHIHLSMVATPLQSRGQQIVKFQTQVVMRCVALMIMTQAKQIEHDMAYNWKYQWVLDSKMQRACATWEVLYMYSPSSRFKTRAGTRLFLAVRLLQHEISRHAACTSVDDA